MNDAQEISIPLSEYLELREKAARNQSIKYEEHTHLTRLGKEGATSYSVSWHLPEEDKGSRLALMLVGRINNLVNDAIQYRNLLITLIRDLYNMNYFKFSAWKKRISAEGDIDKYIEENFVIDGALDDEREEEREILTAAQNIIREIASGSQMSLDNPKWTLPQDVIDRISEVLKYPNTLKKEEGVE